MRRIFLSLLLTALLLRPIAAPAQTLPFSRLPARTVSIQVAFVPATQADLETLGLNSYLVSPTEPSDSPLRYATGKIVNRVGATLTRQSGHAFFPDAVTVADGVAATIPVDIEGSDWTDMKALSYETIIPKKLGDFHLQGKMLIIPHITAGNLVSLEIRLPNDDSKPIQLKAIPSEEPLVIVAPDAQGTKIPFFSGVSRLPDSLPDTEKFLIFITPTVSMKQAALTKSPVPDSRRTTSVDMLDMSLEDAVNIIEHQGGIKCFIRESIEPYGLVNVRLTDCPILLVLNQIAVSAEAKVSRDVRGIYVIRPKYDYTFP